MISLWTLSGVTLAYLAVLFMIAYLGDRLGLSNRPWMHALAMGVHCTTWSFYGTVAQSAHYGWAFVPTYLGCILLTLLGYPLLLRVWRYCQQHKVTSLADFMGMQFGHSNTIAALISVLCLLGVIPYIALQLDALTFSIELLIGQDGGAYMGLYVAALMLLFAIFFGANRLSLSDKHPGLVTAIAFESVVKLLAFATVGLFTLYGIFNGLGDLLLQSANHPGTQALLARETPFLVYGGHMLLGLTALLCLPRQFHINFVECSNEGAWRAARWQFPLYLVAINLFVLPIALGGLITLSGTVNAEATEGYTLLLPLSQGNHTVALVGFIGGLAAATSMIIVATLAVGTMITNHLLMPLWLTVRLKGQSKAAVAKTTLLGFRWLTLTVVIALALLYSLHISARAPLVNSGVIAMALLGQLAPAIILRGYFGVGNKTGLLLGLVAGIGFWFTELLWPSIVASYYFAPSPGDSALAMGVVLSLLANTVIYLVATMLQGSLVGDSHPATAPRWQVRRAALLQLCQRVLARDSATGLIADIQRQQSEWASDEEIKAVENNLTDQVGRSSAKILLNAISDSPQDGLDTLVELVQEVTQEHQFNHSLLNASLEHIDQGISVVDASLTLVAWNSRYVDILGYPEGYIRAGLNVRELLSFNAERGVLNGVKQADIDKRIALIRAGSPYRYRREQQDGRVIELQGRPMPGGGFVTTYNDVTEFVNTQDALRQATEKLEQRVRKRTEQLERLNLSLEAAKTEAEKNSQSKSRFLAAASHDLMQPFNAASLYASMLSEQVKGTKLAPSAKGLVDSLQSAEELLSTLLDLTRLEAGLLKVQPDPFALESVLTGLRQQFAILASTKGLKLTMPSTSLWVRSDKKLLRRMLQNLLSNAIRYTQTGRVSLVARRRRGAQVEIQVLDTGPGIADGELTRIFDEFHQVSRLKDSHGLGLGLTIVEGFSQLLEHPIGVRSTLGKGSQFSLTLPRAPARAVRTLPLGQPSTANRPWLHGKVLWVVDNDSHTQHAMKSLLTSWGATVYSHGSIHALINAAVPRPHLALVDYHLDDGMTGLGQMSLLHRHFGDTIPGVIHSADPHDTLRDKVRAQSLPFMRKPVKPGPLKRILRQYLVASSG